MRSILALSFIFAVSSIIANGCSQAPKTDAKATSSKSPLDQLAWIAGDWSSDDGKTITEEHWTQPRGNGMMGMSRTIDVASGRMMFFEYLQITNDQHGIVYLASPSGHQPPTPFRLIESASNRAVFENLQHDFPQRIIYWREGQLLHARIEGPRHGQTASEEWTWHPMK